MKALRAIDWNAPRTRRIACLLVPLLFGAYSLSLGQDSNWDQFNYHLYNAYALLNGKLGIDLAPAGMQSYFNPVLDVGTYVPYMHLPAPVVGFALGCMHGLNFLLVLSICRSTLASSDERADVRQQCTPSSLPSRALWLAFAACLSANFLSGLGNGMGDNMTALFVLGGMAMLLRGWGGGSGNGNSRKTPATVLIKAPLTTSALTRPATAAPAISVGMLIGAGLLVGIGTALKLTNAVYALALCAALLVHPGSVLTRSRMAFLFGIAVLVGLAAAGGFWFWRVWQTLGNPLFPQFATVFPSPLSASIGVSDQSWLPRNAIETLFWPFIFAFDSKRVGQVKIHEFLWPVLYLLGLAWLCIQARKRLRRGYDTRLGSRHAFILVFIALSYLVWMKLFSIYRYVVPMEMLAPLAVYLLLSDLLPPPRAERVSAIVLVLCSVFAVVGGAGTWGHQPWAYQAFRATVPTLDAPDKTTVLIVGSDPWAWTTIFFPATVAFAGIDGNFPQTPAYEEKVRQMITERGGPAYAILSAHRDRRTDAALTAENAQERLQAGTSLRSHRIALLPDSCELRHAFIGQRQLDYQWCRVELMRQVD